MTGKKSSAAGRPADTRLPLPGIRSARGYRLYGVDGRRYTDFFQNDGYAMDGHRPADALQALKSSAARGLWAEYPSRWQARVEQMIVQLLPFVDRVFLYPHMDAALADASAGLGAAVRLQESPLEFHSGDNTPAAGDTRPVLRWRPFAMGPAQEKALAAGEYGELCIPLIPFPGRFLPVPLCRIRGSRFEPGSVSVRRTAFTEEPGAVSGRRAASAAAPESPGTFSLSPESSPVLCALMVKSIARTRKMMTECNTERWKEFDLPGLDRIGPYLHFRIDGKGYAELYEHMLEEGILLPPARDIPAIIPADYNPGDVKPLLHALRRLYGDG